MWPFSYAYPESHAADIEGQAYDYIVVGGGTAGCAVAARLTEDPDVSVLLIERGATRDHLLSRIPLLSQNFMFKWTTGVTDRFSEPIEAYNGRRLVLVSADGLGGTSRVNGMLLTRGIPGGYEEWAETGTPNGLGLDGWGWKDVEPYFQKMETTVSYGDKDYRGHKGPMSVRQASLNYKFFPYIAKACEAVGLPVEDDFNAPRASAQGFFRLDVAVNADGTRLSTNRAYLSSQTVLERRGRLTICTEAIAAKLQLSEDSTKVTGVYIQDLSASSAKAKKPAVFASARREVIICAGAFRSPQLLMLSGIGPRSHLESMGIPCLHDLPAVGQNLADHMAIPIMIDMPVRETAQRLIEEPLFGLRTFLQHLFFGSGFMAQPTTEASIFARTSSFDTESFNVRKGEDSMDASLPANIPDVEIMLNPCNCINLTSPPEEYAKSPTSGRSYLSLYTTLIQACVDGHMELASATDPTAHTRIYYPTLGADNGPGWQAMRRSVRLAMRLAKEFIETSGYPYPTALTFAPGMDMDLLSRTTRGRVGERPAAPAPAPVPAPAADPSTVTQEAIAAAASPKTKEGPPPVPKTWKTVTDAEIDAYVRETCQSSLHFTSSCRMASKSAEGVVDTHLRVFGITNLRIADASVLPKIPSAHTMAPTLMVAERCADFIKDEWK